MDFIPDFISDDTVEYTWRLVVAMVLGLTLGAERVFAHKTAGMRTYALVSMGATLFVIISEIVTGWYLGATVFDPLRVASQIVVGLGFIGAGIIIFRNTRVQGVTTAAGLWVAGGIGMAAGFHLFGIATVATILTLFVFTALWFVEKHFKTYFRDRIENVDDDL